MGDILQRTEVRVTRAITIFFWLCCCQENYLQTYYWLECFGCVVVRKIIDKLIDWNVLAILLAETNNLGRQQLLIDNLRWVCAPWYLHHEIIQVLREWLFRNWVLAIADVHYVENRSWCFTKICNRGVKKARNQSNSTNQFAAVLCRQKLLLVQPQQYPHKYPQRLPFPHHFSVSSVDLLRPASRYPDPAMYKGVRVHLLYNFGLRPFSRVVGSSSHAKMQRKDKWVLHDATNELTVICLSHIPVFFRGCFLSFFSFFRFFFFLSFFRRPKVVIPKWIRETTRLRRLELCC